MTSELLLNCLLTRNPLSQELVTKIKVQITVFFGKKIRNFVCKTKAKLVNKENISVVEIAITWAPDILRVTNNGLTNGQSLWAWGCPIQLGLCKCCKVPSKVSLRRNSSRGLLFKTPESLSNFILRTVYFNANCVLF